MEQRKLMLSDPDSRARLQAEADALVAPPVAENGAAAEAVEPAAVQPEPPLTFAEKMRRRQERFAS